MPKLQDGIWLIHEPSWSAPDSRRHATHDVATCHLPHWSFIMELLKSNRGGQKLSYDGYMYTKKNSTVTTVYWCCAARVQQKCTGSLTTTAAMAHPQVRLWLLFAQNIVYRTGCDLDVLRILYRTYTSIACAWPQVSVCISIDTIDTPSLNGQKGYVNFRMPVSQTLA